MSENLVIKIVQNVIAFMRHFEILKDQNVLSFIFFVTIIIKHVIELVLQHRRFCMIEIKFH